ncbi:Protein lsb5 [Grifola frondosa]|uniref:Protein lsb5 n=1 Tax=Grifola frondosa TaxID=5627 RepID=A0A1C7LUA8_GRIFR|nr:Protein lsb5 [Grifola frondosa]
MSAMHLAKQAYSAFGREKPHSSITEWVEILTSSSYEDEAYDGIPELVDSINIQATGPAEVSRAIRKKLKHGNSHQQYRALVILRAIVENGGHKFQTSFADSQLTDAIRGLSSDATTDPKVKKKLLSVLVGWHNQFKDDPSMTLVANLYKQCKGPEVRTHTQKPSYDDPQFSFDSNIASYERKKKEDAEKKEKEEKRKAKEEKEKRKKEEQRRKRKATQSKVDRKAFNFEEEKSQILTAVANATQASNNLVNAMTLVNTEHDSLEANERVQECLTKAKQSRKQIVRYVQLVENEDMIGTLIETNDRIITALQSYDMARYVQAVQEGLANAKISNSELGKLQEKQRAAIQRSIGRAGSSNLRNDTEEEHAGYNHPDLQDLNFGALGSDQKNLPPPLRPSAPGSSSDDNWRRGSLSDFSDYQSSDEETHARKASTSTASNVHPHERGFVDDSDEEEVDVRKDLKQGLLEEEDPFADPFVDQEEDVEGEGVGTSGFVNSGRPSDVLLPIYLQ